MVGWAGRVRRNKRMQPELRDPGLEVDRIRPEEWPRLRDLRLRALREDPLAFGSSWKRERSFPEERWRERARQGSEAWDQGTWVLREKEGALSGMVTARAEGEVVAIFALWVEPRLRGRHLGSRLLDRALLWCRTQYPRRNVVLHVNPREAAAVALYVRRGFVFTGESEPLPHGIFEIVVGMRKAPADGPPA